MYEQCTHPDAATYHADLWLLGILESNGIDIPCALLTPALVLAIFGPVILVLFLCAGWQAWRRDSRRASYRPARRRRRRA